MNKKILEIKNSTVWNRDFSDYDDILDNGILKCDEVACAGKVMLSISRTAQIMDDMYDKMLAVFDISRPQLSVLESLYFSKHDFISQEKLSRMVYCSKANISTMLLRMEEKGLIKRKENENNKREKLVYITKEGEKKISEIFEMHSQKKCEKDFLNKDDAEKLISILKVIRKKFKNHYKGCKNV
jgi:DNA-binding MarR family transcriptional regulator